MLLKSLFPLQVEVVKGFQALHNSPDCLLWNLSRVRHGDSLVRGLGREVRYQEDVLATLFPGKNLATLKNETLKGKMPCERNGNIMPINNSLFLKYAFCHMYVYAYKHTYI